MKIDSSLISKCSCPAFVDYRPCKHIAATCFALIMKNTSHYETSEECLDQIEEYENLENILKKKTKNELITIS